MKNNIKASKFTTSVGMVFALVVGGSITQVHAQTSLNSCANGDTPLQITGLCPAEANSAFLLGGDIDTPAAEGCFWGVNETAIGGNVLLYNALVCGNTIAAFDFAGGAHGAVLTAISNSDYAAGVEVTVRTVYPSDAYASITNYARVVMSDSFSAAQCYAQEHGENGENGAIVVNVDPATFIAAGPDFAACGPLGLRDDDSHWRAFGDLVWYVSLGQDGYYAIAPESMTLLERGDGLNGWRVKY